MARKETRTKKKGRDILSAEETDKGQVAPWFKEEISRRRASSRIGKGLAISSALAMAGVSIYKVASSDDDEITLDSLELQKQQGWNVGSTEKYLVFPAGSVKQLDSLNQTDWTKYLEPSRLIAAVKPSSAQWQPFFVATLIQGLAQNSLRTQLLPISTTAMTEAYNRAQGLGELISQSQNASETLLIADLPGPESVAVGAGLADKFTVIPAFDNWPHPLGIVHSHETLGALVGYASEIEEKKKKLTEKSPAIILLDNTRLAPYVDADSQFDNRYLAKVPPASELKQRGIKNVIYVVPTDAQKEELDDLNDEFVDWQKNGIEVKMLGLNEFKESNETVATNSPTGTPVTTTERHYYYGGSPMMHWWFYSNYFYHPYPTVIVTRGGRGVPLTRPPANVPPPRSATTSYRPVSRPTIFSASRVGGVYGVGRTRPSGFGRSSVRMSSGRVTGTRAGRSGSWEEAGDGFRDRSSTKMATSFYLIIMVVLGLLMTAGIWLSVRNSKKISESRRSFLRGRGKDDNPAIFFGLQIAIQVFGSDDLRAQLARLIQAEDETDTSSEKRRFIKSVASLLTENQYAWEYGFWEYIEESDSAISSFNQWKNEIEASMATEPAELGGEVDRLHRFSDEKEYLIVTFLLLVDNRDETVTDDVGDYQFRPTYEQLAAPFRNRINSLEESAYWTSATFSGLLEGLRAIDPRAIERDAIYIYPGSEQDGLSSLDLIGDDGWKYLTDHSFRLN